MKRTFETVDAAELNTTATPAAAAAKATSAGRVPFTTMIRPQVRAALLKVANNNGCSMADVLETVVCEYFDIQLPE